MQTSQDICRVCHSTSGDELGQLFHPCLCSGSMKFIHQTCLEDWLAHSGKKHCDICNHVFQFAPVYASEAPAKLSLLDISTVILKRIYKHITLYSRIGLALFMWIIWVPYVASWSYKMFLNPKEIVDNTPESTPPYPPIVSKFLIKIFSFSEDHYLISLIQHAEQIIDWKSFLKSFISNVFEGQIITAMLVIAGLILLLVREYLAGFHMNDGQIQNQEAENDALEQENQNLNQENINAPQNPENLTLNQIEKLQELREKLEVLQDTLTDNWQDDEDERKSDIQARANTLSRFKNLRETLEKLQDHMGGVEDSDSVQAWLQNKDPEDALDILMKKYETLSNEKDQTGALVGSSKNTAAPKANNLDSNTGRSSSGYNLRPRRNEASSSNTANQDSKGKGKAKIDLSLETNNIETEQDDYKISTPYPNLSSAQGPDFNFDNLDTLNLNFREREDSQQEPEEHENLKDIFDSHSMLFPESITESDVLQEQNKEGDLNATETDGGTSRNVQQELVNEAEIQDEEQNEPINAPENDNQVNNQLVNQNANNLQGLLNLNPELGLREGLMAALAEDPNPDGQINIGLNVGIADGEIVAQIELNDVNAFLDLVGVNGSIFKLFQSVLLAHLLIFFTILFALWTPYLFGNVFGYIFTYWLIPNIELTLKFSIELLQKISDPIIDPLVEGLIDAFNSSEALSATIKSLNASSLPATNSSIFNMVNTTLPSGNSTFSLYHNNFFTQLQNDISTIFFGYIIISILVLLYAHQAGLTEHPYMMTVARMFNSFNTNLSLCVKIIMFVTLELAGFPFYCGVMIDLFTLPLFGKGATIASRYALYKAYPWMFVFIHWIIGSTFMFQFAMYVSMIRDILRPGVLWFIRDPNDPQFNAMREIIRRPVQKQIRKLLIGVLLYGTILTAVIGGSIQFILAFDYLVINYISEKSLLKVFPLRLEYLYYFHLISSDSISEIPFDLFFFQFLFPQLISFIEPKTKFFRFVRNWFSYVSKKLSLSSFLLGGEHPEEESDCEDQVEIRHLTIDDKLERDRNQSEILDDDSSARPFLQNEEDEWEDDEVSEKKSFDPEELFESEGFSQPKNLKREKRYLRVPNTDRIEIIPGEPMLVWIKESDPVFGRPHETPEEVHQYWTKVYAPDLFFWRIAIVFILQWLSFLVLLPLSFMIPLLSGRVFFFAVGRITTLELSIPKEYKIPVAASRLDIPTHDLYALFAGLCLVYCISLVLLSFWNLFMSEKSLLRRRHSIRRSSRTRLIPAETYIPPLIQYADSLNTWWARKGEYAFKKLAKSIYLVIVLGIIIPLCNGFLINTYLMSPIHSIHNRQPINFVLLDWSTGAMATRVIYNIVLLAPNRPIARVITQAINEGLGRINLQPLNEKIFLPYIFGASMCLLAPFFANIIEIYLDLPDLSLSTLVQQFGPPASLGLYLGAKLLFNMVSSFNDWLEHLKDDLYLVGRQLQNVQ